MFKTIVWCSSGLF